MRRWDADKEKVFPLAVEVKLTIGQAAQSVQQAGDIINDSLRGWKDADELHRLNGAESDFYLKLPVPYRARNGARQDTAELLQISGVTPRSTRVRRDSRGWPTSSRLRDATRCT